MSDLAFLLVAVVAVVLCPTTRWPVAGDLNSRFCPDGCRCLDKASVLSCTRSHLRHIPGVLSTALVLDLDYNAIGIVQNSSFDGADHLQIISMQNNGLIHIEAGAFQPLSRLHVLRLGNNHLSHLPGNIFWNNRELEVLDLHGNLFVDIPDGVMYHLHSLKLLNMSLNHITTPALGTGFKYTTQLSSLDLSYNNFVTLDARVFQATHWWDERVTHSLNLSYCNIRHMHPNALSQLYRLETLSFQGNNGLSQEDLRMALQNLEVSSLQVLILSNMNISDITDFFSRFQHRQLQRLDLSWNHLREVAPRSFYYLINLRELDISHNNLVTIGDLSGLSHLQVLTLTYNNIETLGQTDFEGVNSVRVLDLSHNSMTAISTEPFANLWDLEVLDLSHNDIMTFTMSAGLENLQRLNLASNQISDVTSLGHLLRLTHLDVSDNAIASLPRGLFSRGHTLEKVNFSHNSISSIDRFAFQNTAQDVLDLSHNQISTLGHYAWRRIKKLYLQGNLISNISLNAFDDLNTLLVLDLSSNNLRAFIRNCFANLYNLKWLSLSYNPLGDYFQTPGAVSALSVMWKLETLQLSHMGLYRIPITLFANLTLLKSLNLSGNKLTQVPSGALASLIRMDELDLSDNSLTIVDPVVFTKIPHLHKIDVSMNPLQCTCELMPFRNWLLTSNMSIIAIRDRTQYYCMGPPEWKGIPLQEFHLQSDTCSHRETAVIYATIGCTMLAIILTAAVAVYRYKCWGNDKHPRTHYSAIDETSTVQVNPRHHSERHWV